MSDETILGKLDFIIEILKRMEMRQVAIKQEVEEQPQIGSFGTVNK